MKFDDVKVKAFAPRVQVEGEAPVKFNAPDELRVTTPVPEPILLVPVEVKEVNVPAAAVDAPIAVPLIPVAVVLKLVDVKVKALPVASIEDAPNPERVRAPDDAVKFSAPAERVKPLLAVRRPAEVIVPPLVVVIFPVVEIVILAARSFPDTDENVGRPEAFP